MARRIKNEDGLTQRQRQSQQIMREKKAKKQRQALLRKCQIAVMAAGCIAILGAGVWLWKTSAVSRTVQSFVDSTYGLTIRAGFTLQNLYLEGRNRTPMSDLQKALGVKKGDAILRLSLSEVKERLEKVESVRFAAVERELPSTLYVRIIEREPVALWQYQGKMALVDDNGAVMKGLDMSAYQNLPLIVGEDAPKHVAEVLTIIASQPDLAKRFAAAVRVGGRRWNIRLDKGVEVKLPENNPQEAWKTLADLEARQQLLDRDVKVIDLRLDGRLFIKVAPQETPGKTANAKET